MPQNKKPRTITYFELSKKEIATGDEHSFQTLRDILNSAHAASHPQKLFELDEKKVFLASLENRSGNLQVGFTVSLYTNYRPDVVEENTGSKRPNPKNNDEGDEEKTHFVVKYTSDKVYLLVENNSKAISPKKIPLYFNYLYKTFNPNESRTYNLKYATLAVDNFEQVLERLTRAKTAEIIVEKPILGSQYMQMSNRTSTVKREIKVTVSAERKASIKDFSEDVYQLYSSGGLVKKITIIGVDEDNSPIKIDTSFMEKKSYIYAEVNEDKGDLKTIDTLREMVTLANAL